MQNSFDIFLAIKLILDLDVFFQSVLLEFSEEMTYVLQTKNSVKKTIDNN